MTYRTTNKGAANMEIVLVTKGKHEDVDSVKIVILPSKESAEEYCILARTGRAKYWTDAQIINDCEEIELMQPEWE